MPIFVLLYGQPLYRDIRGGLRLPPGRQNDTLISASEASLLSSDTGEACPTFLSKMKRGFKKISHDGPCDVDDVQAWLRRVRLFERSELGDRPPLLFRHHTPLGR
ncbi:hypothetical protein M758_UG194000 [Ceratodon purpureus]|nr:hypothetical protein M758_UG194000 [Ceratodon purpureus]